MPAFAAERRAVAMKRILFVVWALAMWQIAVWTFSPARTQTATAVVRADGKAHGDSEPAIARGRDYQRAGALRALEQPTAVICTEEGRKRVVSGLSEYFYHRQAQLQSYPRNFGTPGADYIARQWSTAGDLRIDRLVREAYGRGYIVPDDLTQSFARKTLLSIVEGVRVTGKGCAA